LGNQVEFHQFSRKTSYILRGKTMQAVKVTALETSDEGNALWLFLFIYVRFLLVLSIELQNLKNIWKMGAVRLD